jgi:hypothetical protein
VVSTEAEDMNYILALFIALGSLVFLYFSWWCYAKTYATGWAIPCFASMFAGMMGLVWAAHAAGWLL